MSVLTGILWILAVQETAPPGTAPRHPEPSAEEFKAAQKEVRDLFRAEYAQSSRAARQALAARFLQFGRDPAEKPGVRYAVLREAVELAIQAEDVATALAALEELSARFAVDGVSLKEGALSRFRGSSASPEEARALAGAWAALLREALAADAYDAASRMAPKVQAAVRAAKDASLQGEVEALAKELPVLREEYGRAARCRSILAENPADPEANAGWGAFLCLVKGDWEKGLPLLARGSDPKLREAAEKDLAGPADPREQAAAGDAWASLAEAERRAPRKARLIERASHWYRAALPRLEGIAKLKAAARLEEWEKSAPRPAAGPGGPVVDLLAWIDPADHSVHPQSRWTLRGRVLVSGRNTGDQTYSRLLIPCAPPPEYDLTVTVQRAQGEGPFGVGLVAGGRQFVVLLRGGRLTAGLFDGEDSHDLAEKYPRDQVAHSGPPVPAGRPVTIVCSVRARRLQVALDGRPAIDWKNPPWDEASVPEGMEVPDARVLFLAGRDVAQFEVSGLLLKPVSGGSPRRIADLGTPAPRSRPR